MKPRTIVFLVFASLGVLGYLCYGWLLLETIESGTNVVMSIVFTDLFILWLMPLAVGVVLLIMELIKKEQH